MMKDEVEFAIKDIDPVEIRKDDKFKPSFSVSIKVDFTYLREVNWRFNV